MSPVYGDTQKEIRILIDVSGSMKWNDPENLRVPALKLITGLLPKNTNAGVWTFGKYVNMLVPVGTVDNAWRKHAMTAAGKISSHGLYTNIEDTLADASWGWSKPDENAQRSIILLTDGYVDISANETKSQDSRSRILNVILPKLQQAGVTIHTIALSEDADTGLLRQLATATNGSHEQAQTAEELERIFFHMFERAADPDTLPLENNSVLVDDSIEELTLLVFHGEHSPPTRLSTPNGISFSHDKIPPNVRWHHEQRYDLVTIDEPMVGTWHIDADVDPDNRVMVVANLKVVTTRLPENISLGDQFTFLVRLLENNKTIEKKEFLHFIKVNVTQESDTGEQWDWMMLDNGRGNDAQPSDGTYTLDLDKSLNTGTHHLTVEVDGTTFKRIHRQTFHVYDNPVLATIEPLGNADLNEYVLTIIPRAGMISPETMQVNARLSDGQGMEETMTIPRVNHNEWRLLFSDYPSDRAYQLELVVSGEKPSGKPVSSTIGPLRFGSSSTINTTASDEIAEEPEDVTKDEAGDPSESTANISDAAQETETSWWLVGFQVILFNAIIFAGLFFSYKRWFSSRMQVPDSWKELPQE